MFDAITSNEAPTPDKARVVKLRMIAERPEKSSKVEIKMLLVHIRTSPVIRIDCFPNSCIRVGVKNDEIMEAIGNVLNIGPIKASGTPDLTAVDG